MKTILDNPGNQRLFREALERNLKRAEVFEPARYGFTVNVWMVSSHDETPYWRRRFKWHHTTKRRETRPSYDAGFYTGDDRARRPGVFLAPRRKPAYRIRVIPKA